MLLCTCFVGQTLSQCPAVIQGFAAFSCLAMTLHFCGEGSPLLVCLFVFVLLSFFKIYVADL